MLILRLVLGDKERDLPLSCIRGLSSLSTLEVTRRESRFEKMEHRRDRERERPRNSERRVTALRVRKVETVHEGARGGETDAGFVYWKLFKSKHVWNGARQ